jgi:hypothetical protein
VGGGGTEAGTKAGASACSLVSWPPNDLPPVTVLSCSAGFVPRSGKVRTPPRPLLRFLRVSELFGAWVADEDSGMLDKVAMSAMLDRRVMVVVGFAQRCRLSKVQLWRSSIGKRLGKENGGFKKPAS